MLDSNPTRHGSAAGGSFVPSAATSDGALRAGWREGLAVINLRGAPDDPAFLAAAAAALGLPLPTTPCTTREDEFLRVVWAGPDDWFVLGPRGQADAIAQRLRTHLAGLHAAVTDASSGYTVLSLAGRPAREVLAQGCPLDLHPRAFEVGRCTGTHFFKASVWLWQTGSEPCFELLVRRSFMGYAWLMLERATAECGLRTQREA